MGRSGRLWDGHSLLYIYLFQIQFDTFEYDTVLCELSMRKLYPVTENNVFVPDIIQFDLIAQIAKRKAI